MGKIRKVFELENMATETSKTEKQRIERLGKMRTEHSRTMDNYKGVTYV